MQLPNHGVSCKLFSADLSLRSIRSRDLQFPEPWHFLTSLPCHVHTFLSDRKFCGIFLFSLSIDAVSTRIREENRVLRRWTGCHHTNRLLSFQAGPKVDQLSKASTQQARQGFPSGVGPRRLP
ncbi:hypothetical protein PVAP13_3NG208200 [Panicum virgatum]|uniref:Uncharacterized protein n=1 Tax=Panicum virgatum TaxID=38727 RepID=A0A8T0UI37_PANVG|nr:hypothetical protein PVAP13_3NG208200 [Panicum virgatum]KAG2620574.1 hypothetical protein PVAP13_3NG208200 [Panicum virgatum]